MLQKCLWQLLAPYWVDLETRLTFQDTNNSSMTNLYEIIHKYLNLNELLKLLKIFLLLRPFSSIVSFGTFLIKLRFRTLSMIYVLEKNLAFFGIKSQNLWGLPNCSYRGKVCLMDAKIIFLSLMCAHTRCVYFINLFSWTWR